MVLQIIQSVILCLTIPYLLFLQQKLQKSCAHTIPYCLTIPCCTLRIVLVRSTPCVYAAVQYGVPVYRCGVRRACAKCIKHAARCAAGAYSGAARRIKRAGAFAACAAFAAQRVQFA